MHCGKVEVKPDEDPFLDRATHIRQHGTPPLSALGSRRLAAAGHVSDARISHKELHGHVVGLA